VQYDEGSDFIILNDNYLFGEDDIPKLKEALNYNSKANFQQSYGSRKALNLSRQGFG
jgi:hypothetical protein